MAAKKYDFTATEFKAGCMVLASVAVFAGFLMAILGTRTSPFETTYVVHLNDTKGLNMGADVRYGGARVGRVTDIRLDPDDQSNIIIEVRVAQAAGVNMKSQAFVSQVTLTSAKHLEITTGELGAPRLEEGAAIPAQAGGLFAVADQVADVVSSLGERIETLLGGPEQRGPEGEPIAFKSVADVLTTVDGTLTEGRGFVSEARDTLADSRPQVEELLTQMKDAGASAQASIDKLHAMLNDNRANVTNSLNTMRELLAKVDDAASKLDGITTELEKTMQNANTLVTDADTFVVGADDTLAGLQPKVEDILQELQETLENLNAFSRTISEQPNAFIRGRQPQGRK